MRTRLLALAVALAAPAFAGAQNLALGRPAFGSSIYSANDLPGDAVDGDTDGSYGAGTMFHSGTQTNGWWYVDLGQTYDVDRIEFWNRTDCCSARIVGATLGIFDAVPYQGGSPAPVWSLVIPASTTHQIFDPDTQGTGTGVGRYVGILAPSQGDAWLQIAELEVYGAVPGSVAPEPATVALVGGGLLALGAVARRRRTR